MRVLIGCEFSGIVREAFASRGHDAWSCDLKPSERPGNHYRQDIFTVLWRDWDLLIAHPECTFLCNASVHCLHRTPPNPSPGKIYGESRWRAMRDAAEFFKRLLHCCIPKVAIENPVMHRYGLEIIGQQHDQTIQPYQFGDDASKRTCLWLRDLPKLKPTRYVEPRIVNGRKLWANQTDSGQNKLTPSPTRSQERARTYAGIAQAMAEQWG